MAVVKGTNAGFVTVAPTSDPAGTSSGSTVDARSSAMKDTSPSGGNKITEIGWWCDGATEESNFEVGLYSHHVGNDKPDARLFVNATNAKGTSSGWKTVAVDWSISASTIYWIAVQVDNTATTTNTDRNADAGDRRSISGDPNSLIETWSAGSTETSWYYAIYAKTEVVVANYSELAGTIAATTTVTGNIVLGELSELSGTIAAVSTVGPSSLGSVTVELDIATAYIKRLVTAGSNQFWYEDI